MLNIIRRFELAQDCVLWQALVLAALNLQAVLPESVITHVILNYFLSININFLDILLRHL
jgi:hypothetical protein